MSGPGTAGGPSLIESLKDYVDGLPAAERADALHQVFYGFYARVAIIDRTTHELAAVGKADVERLGDLAPTLAEALRDNALFVGQELFASRVRTMAAMAYVSERLADHLDHGAPPQPFTLTHAVAFDDSTGALRTYDLAQPGVHPDLPYDPAAYNPRES